MRTKNIITNALGVDEFFRVSNCKTAQEMWDTLQVTHEGTSEVKRARINTLTHEYELFRMNQGESIQEMQKRFTHIVNHLASLGKTFSNEDLINKVLRCLNRNWQPKVTAISESRNLATMTLATLFGKLQEHEMELSRLSQSEDHDKKKKGIALKASTSELDDDDEESNADVELDEENLALLVRKFGKFLKKKGNTRRSPFPPKRNFSKGEKSNSTPPTCFECGKPGHIKMDCPTFQKRVDRFERRNPKEKKSKRAYIAWDDNDMDSTDDSDDEEANLCFMANDDLEVQSPSHDLSPTYDELQDAFEELHDESIRLAKLVSTSKKTILILEDKISILNKEVEDLKIENETLGLIDANSSCPTCMTHEHASTLSSCQSCKVFKKEIEDLNNILAKFTFGRDNLNILLGKQRCIFDKAGLGYKPKTQ